MRRQEAPFSIQVELNEGCTLGCNFCGLRGMREEGKEPWYPMQRETAERISDEIARVGWHSRIIFSMHGEPTLNVNALRIIRMFRKKLPEAVLSMMSNGYGIANSQKYSIIEMIRQYKTAGLNDLIIDYYSTAGDAKKIDDALEGNQEFQVDHLAPKIPLYSTNAHKFRVLFNPPIQKEGAINRHLCNHCGAAAPLDMSYQGKRCARPFRELSIRYDGSVSICCNDFRGQYPIGNVMNMKIEDIWWSKEFEAARILLYHGDRSFTPCLGCNALSHRVGLLPDKNGKEDMPEPTEKILSYARSISKRKPFANNIVKRPWEKE